MCLSDRNKSDGRGLDYNVELYVDGFEYAMPTLKYNILAVYKVNAAVNV